MYYSDIGPHVRGQGGKILMYEEWFIFVLLKLELKNTLSFLSCFPLHSGVDDNKSFIIELPSNNLWLYWSEYKRFRKSATENLLKYCQAWTYHPMLNISVIPQRKYNLAPSVINKLYNTEGAKVVKYRQSSLTFKDAVSNIFIFSLLFRLQV